MTHALVVGGGPPPRAMPAGPFDLVVAVDSGYDHAVNFGLRVDVLVGDLDSISASGLSKARRAGVTIEAHAREKDATDLELAMVSAMQHGASAITYVAGRGGRLDHELVGLLHLASRAYASITVDALVDESVVHVVGPARSLAVRGAPGDIVSLVAVGGTAVVSLHGFRYLLQQGRLEPSSTLAVSNELGPTGAGVVEVDEGVVLVIHTPSTTGGP